MDLFDQFLSLFSDFTNPKKRLFLGNVALSVLLGFVVLFVIRRQSLRASLTQIFSPKIWFSGSARADYKIFIINRVLTGFISPVLLTQVAVATALYTLLINLSYDGWGLFAGAPAALVVASFSVAMFVADDFTKYLLHRWMHTWPILWPIHKVHHSAETLTPMTVYRVHPLEGVLYATRSTIAQGPVIALFYYLFGDTVNLVTILGVNGLVFLFHVTGSNLRHSHVDIRYPKWLEHILISPAQHQIHHSIAEEHYDKNFGAALAVWDWLFGSLHVSEDQHDMQFGLRSDEGHSTTSLRVMYLRPFAELWAAGNAGVCKSGARWILQVIQSIAKRLPLAVRKLRANSPEAQRTNLLKR